MNKAKLYEVIKSDNLLGSAITQSEVDGIEAVLKACKDASWPISFTSYGFATAYHETAHTFKPIKEYGEPTYFTKMYDINGARPALAAANGNTSPGDGAKYFGRGYVQLTWKNNYAKAEKKCGIIGLVKNPELALIEENAAKIMISGMTEGWFAPGKSCSKYLNSDDKLATLAQFIEARKIINGSDKNELIASYAIKFQNALHVSEY